MIINAKDMIVGRIATLAAKKALLGEKVDIINSEYAIMTGKKEHIYSEYKTKRDLGTFKGPFISRMADRFLKRVIRGMLPYKNDRGENAFKRITCHIGVPKELEGMETVKMDDHAKKSKLKVSDYLTIKEICSKMGSKMR
jgi:large subunit ribosomal protein L13